MIQYFNDIVMIWMAKPRSPYYHVFYITMADGTRVTITAWTLMEYSKVARFGQSGFKRKRGKKKKQFENKAKERNYGK